VINFGKVQVSTGYDSTATSIVLTGGGGAKLPTPPFNLVWWNSTDYSDPADDLYVEIVRCTNKVSDTLTITRAQEGTAASNKNLTGKTYKMILAPTKKIVDDLVSDIAAKESTANKNIANGYAPLDSGVHVPLSNISGITNTQIASNADIAESKLGFSTWKVISEQILSSTVQDVDFTGLDISTDLRYELYFAIYNPTGGEVTYNIYVNGDYTDTHYYVQTLKADGSTVTAARTNAPNLVVIPAGSVALGSALIHHRPTFFGGRFGYTGQYGIAQYITPQTTSFFGSRTYSSSSNITSLRIHASVATGICGGSTFILSKQRTK
jgi:hypothetical protein